MEGQGSSSHFLWLIDTFQHQAIVHLGKIVNPMTGKAERNLEAAKQTIDLIGMLEQKTRGNLTSEESRFLQQVLTMLRLNFVDEAGRSDSAEPPLDESAAGRAGAGAAGAAPAEPPPPSATAQGEPTAPEPPSGEEPSRKGDEGHVA